MHSFKFFINYSTASTSRSLKIKYSLPSSLNSVPEYFAKTTSSPTLTSGATRVPLSSTRPAPTAITLIVKKRGKKFFNRLYKSKRSITFDYAPLIALFYFHINKVCAFCCQSSVLLPLPCAKSALPPPRPLKISFAFLQYSRQSALTPSEWPNI